MNSNLDAKRRFANRVEAYELARPGYPSELYNQLLATLPGAGSAGAASSRCCAIAELGSGTGIFAREILRRGHQVFCVEPNEAMRDAAERGLSSFARFTSVSGCAEATTLEDHSVDLAVSAQAFHWFDFDRTRAEVERILRPSGIVA